MYSHIIDRVNAGILKGIVRSLIVFFQGGARLYIEVSAYTIVIFRLFLLPGMKDGWSFAFLEARCTSLGLQAEATTAIVECWKRKVPIAQIHPFGYIRRSESRC